MAPEETEKKVEEAQKNVDNAETNLDNAKEELTKAENDDAYKTGEAIADFITGNDADKKE